MSQLNELFSKLQGRASGTRTTTSLVEKFINL